MIRTYKYLIVCVVIIFLFFLYETLKAFDDGIVGLTKRSGNTEGCTCHSLTPFSEVSVIILAPSVVHPNDTVDCVLKISGGPLVAGGCDIAAGTGNVITSPADTSLQRLLASISNYELTHRYPKFPSADTVYFLFKYIAPNTPGITDTIFANGNSVNFNGMPTGDEWDYAANKLITISNPLRVTGNSSVVRNFRLNQNYPNPFNPNTNIKYQILRNGNVVLKVYDVTGKVVSTLVNSFQSAGIYEINFASEKYNLSSGAYIYKISFSDPSSPGNNFSDSKRMILIK